MISDEEEGKSQLELQEEIRLLKKKVKDLEQEREILLALHLRDLD